MKAILDTQVWLWWNGEPERLNRKVQALILDRENELFLSVASTWEIAIKYSLGKLRLPEPPGDFLPPRMIRDSLVSLPISQLHALRVAELPHHHRDPFDRMIIAQAQVEKLPVVTADGTFRRYSVQTIRAD